MERASESVESVRSGAMRRVILGGAVGNFIEWFDYGIYGYMAVTIGKVFFPSTDPTASLLASFAVFGSAFVVRPLGGAFFGALGDRLGRRRVLALVIALMSGATVAAGFLPSYAAIGVAAPAILVLLRLLQGFSAGGEFGGAVAFVGEHAPPRRRGLMVSWLEWSSMLAQLATLGLVALLTYLLAPAGMTAWGWRIPFLLALPLGLISLYIRLQLEETPAFRSLAQQDETSKVPFLVTVTKKWRTMLLCAGIIMIKAVGVYTCITYMPTYMSQTLELSPSLSFVPTVIGLCVMLLLIPVMGALSDRVGRKPVFVGACAGFVVLTYPAFLLMSVSVAGAIAAVVVLLVIFSGIYGTSAAVMIELFPTSVRYSGASIPYNVSVAAFGGSAPFIATLLISVTGSELSPALYVIAAAVLSLISGLLVVDLARRPLLQHG